MTAEERQMIYEKVENLNRKIRQARECRNDITSKKNEAGSARTRWLNAYAGKKGSEITSKVYVKGMFRGRMAETLGNRFPPKTAQMNSIGNAAGNVVAAAGNQQRRLDEYIQRLETEKQGWLNKLTYS